MRGISSFHEGVRFPSVPNVSKLTKHRTRRRQGYTPLDRDGPYYTRLHYRAHWQPVFAIIGLVTCTLLMIFSGWAAIYALCINSEVVIRADAISDLVAVYLGVSIQTPVMI